MTCRKCGVTLPPSSGRGRPRVMCVECSPPKQTRKRVESRALSLVAALPVEAPAAPPESVVEAARLELRAAGVEASSAGMTALVLADAIDAHNGEPSQLLAGLARQFHASMSEALAPAETAETDDLDLLLADG